jgi:precorrin-6Y C5,15-methyltransferase (decarboxylating)
MISLDKQIQVIGLGDNGKESLLPQHLEAIEQAEVLVGGERHLQFFPEFRGRKIMIKGSLKEVFEQVKQTALRTVILASGDPLFYGIGAYANKQADAQIHPNVSSVQLAFARIGESWHDAYMTSLHGRSIKGLAQRIDGKDKIALLTDEENSPSVIADYLLSFGMKEYRAFVAENLGGPAERTGWYELDELKLADFSALNVVILRKHSAGPVWPLGIDDEEFAQRKPDKGLITKKEVRILSLAELKLQTDSVVWDIGTCTGSVAIEAARIARHGEVFAIEKNEGDLLNCIENSKKFRVDFTAVLGKAPEGLEQFADPDAIFIGGSGGEMDELLLQCCGRLKPGGRIVLNAVTIETLYEACKAFEQQGFETHITMVQVSRSKPILHMKRLEALNPVYIITAKQMQPKAADPLDQEG